MKQSSSSTHFGGIPLDTNTLAGQWMTFSHMANHYRKLLNVKPRVDTGLVAGGGGGSSGNLRGSYHNLSINSKMMQSSKPGKKKKNSTNGNNASTANCNHHYHHNDYSSRNRDSLMYSSHPDHLNTSSSCGKTSKPNNPSISNDNIELTIKSPLKNGRSKKKALTSHYPEYQVVFGPSSIRSSSDAFLSDDTASTVSNDNNKPPPDVQAPIGVTEKIRRFLNHIHQLDLTSATTAIHKPSSISKKSKRVTTAPLTPTCSSVVTAERPVSVNSTTATASNRQSRHSKCFLPYEPPSPKTPRKSVSASVPVTTAVTGSGGKSGRNQNQVSNKKSGFSVVEELHHRHHHQQFSKSAHHFHHHLQESQRMTRNKFTGSGGDINLMIPEKDVNSGGGSKRLKTRRRAESIASIGTICGSDELTAEDYHGSIKDIYSTLERSREDENVLLQRIMDDNMECIKASKKSRKVLHEHDRNKIIRPSTGATNLVKSTSVASLVPSSTTIDAKPSRNHHHHNHHHNDQATTGSPNGGNAHNISNGNNNNKDSSRDSAYGFSSGESRITTRESTPEKKCLSDKHHHHEGAPRTNQTHQNKSHVDFEDLKPKKDAQTSSTSIDKRHRSSKGMQRQSSRSSSTVDLRRKNSNERYITFLADLTHDIVRKGIYTNKGLKILFKSHLEQNKELNPNKLADMVEHLRMDLGIPKDDSLDKIEFGYGSVSDPSSIPSYFYTPSALPHDKLSTESVILSAKTAASSSSGIAVSGHPNDDDPPSSHPSSPSPTTIIPTAVIPEVVDAVATAAMTSTTTGFSSSGGPNTSSNRSSSTTGTATEDGGSGAGDFISEDNFITSSINPLSKDKHHQNDEDDDEDEGHNEGEDDELSLSETEVSQYLKVAGLDDGTMQSVMGILKS